MLQVPAGLFRERLRFTNSFASVSLSAQVLFCYEQFDELTLLHLREFDKKKLISVETDIVVDHYKEEKFEDSKPGLPPSLTLLDLRVFTLCTKAKVQILCT